MYNFSADEEELMKQKALGLLLQRAGEEKLAKDKLVPSAYSTVASWKRDLERHLKCPSALPKVTKADFQDAEKLLKAKTAVKVEAKVKLRKPKFLRFMEDTPEEIVLLQFDPNFKTNDVVCRHPCCKNKNPKAPKRHKGVKRDLYLCPSHQEHLKSHILQALEKEKIQLPRTEFASESSRFEGYTAIISLLEGTYHERRQVPTTKKSCQIVDEAILNVRNFLIITSTLLNPDCCNAALALPPVLSTFQRILEAIGDNEQMQNLLLLLRGMIDMILFAFGVMFTWISLTNPGAKIGAGIGGCVGAAGFALGPLSGIACAATGVVLGGLIGSGAYMLIKENRDQQNIARARQEWLAAGGEGGHPGADREPQVAYSVSGDAWGGLTMYITLARAWRE